MSLLKRIMQGHFAPFETLPWVNEIIISGGRTHLPIFLMFLMFILLNPHNFLVDSHWPILQLNKLRLRVSDSKEEVVPR